MILFGIESGYGQVCIFGNPAGGSTFSNTSHTFTLLTPSSLPTGGTGFNLSGNYYNDFGGLIPISSTSATLAVTASQLVITDNIAAHIYPDLTTTTGTLIFTKGSASYKITWFYDQTSCDVVPVTLISFTGQVYNSTNIKLNWQTADEYNLSAYFVQRSPNGSTFTDIQQIAALNTGGNHNYQYIDCSPFTNFNYYRLKIVDIDGTTKYSNVIVNKCTTCTGIPPVNCSEILISGPTTVCTTDTFSLAGATSCSYATWSLSPGGMGTITSTGNLKARLNKTTPSGGSVVISATVPGCTSAFTKTIQLVALPLTTSVNESRTQAYTKYTITVNNPAYPGSSYSWYGNGNYLGYGTYKAINVYPNNLINYMVNVATSCGISYGGGADLSYHAPAGGGGCDGPLYNVSQKSGTIVVNSILPCNPPPGPLTANSTNSTTTTTTAKALPDDYELRLLDFQGMVIKDVTHVSLKNTYNINVSGINAGNYSLLIINSGEIVFTQKLRIN